MRKWRARLPEGSLGRTRLAATGIGLVAVLSELAQLGNPLHPAIWTACSALAILVIAGLMLITYARGRTQWWCVVPMPVAIALGGSGLHDPVASTALAMASTLVLSLYGSMRLWTVRLLGAVVAVPTAVALSPVSSGRPMGWHSATVMGVLPQMALMAVITRVLYVALARQERNGAREAILSRTGRAMLGVTDAAQIRELGRQALAELAALSPGVIMLVVRGDEKGLWVSSLSGASAPALGSLLPADTLTDTGALPARFPGYAAWHIDTPGADRATADLFIAVGARRAVPRDVLDAFLNLSLQVVLGERGCRAHAELEHRAHHDHLTQLPTRSKFARGVELALETSAPGTVALLNVDLDNFKEVNDRFGHAAGDELLIELADRMAATAQGRGMAGRFGGDEFAVLLTGLSGPAEARLVAEALCARLAEPVRLTVTTVTTGASIGVAVAGPDVTSTELARQADMAMYRAKTTGKNRVETFTVRDSRLAA